MIDALRRADTDAAVMEDVATDEESAVVAGSGRAIVCAACRHPVTTERQRIRVNDSHEHRFVNPHGYWFHIGCFRHAPGCTTRGAPTSEFTWFPGCAWCFALCAGCGAHLGWRYTGAPSSSFFGLILNRLATEEQH